MRKLIDAHRFFVKETPSFIGNFIHDGSWTYPIYKLTFRQKLYYPIAYIKFMWMTIK